MQGQDKLNAKRGTKPKIDCGALMTSTHRRCKLNGSPANHEFPVLVVMDCLEALLRRNDPGPRHFQDEKSLFRNQAGIDHFGFTIGNASSD
jgi:hypothetical protein